MGAQRELRALVESEEAQCHLFPAGADHARAGFDGHAARQLEVDLDGLSNGQAAGARYGDTADRDVLAAGAMPLTECVHEDRTREGSAKVHSAICRRRKQSVGPND
jgi:hypothetical protein